MQVLLIKEANDARRICRYEDGLRNNVAHAFINLAKRTADFVTFLFSIQRIIAFLVKRTYVKLFLITC